MIWDISHHLVVRTSEAPPQIFTVGLDEKDDMHWLGMRLIHLVDDTWIPFVQAYDEKCPVINFRYFFIPYMWREEFLYTMFVGKISPGFLNTFEVFATDKDVVDYLGVLAEQSEEVYRQPMYATLLLFENAQRVLSGEGESLYDFTAPIYEKSIEDINRAKRFVHPTIG